VTKKKASKSNLAVAYKTPKGEVSKAKDKSANKTAKKKSSKPKDESTSKTGERQGESRAWKSIAARLFRKWGDFLNRTNPRPDGTEPVPTLKDVNTAILFWQRWPHFYRILREAGHLQKSGDSEKFVGLKGMQFILMSERARDIVCTAVETRGLSSEHINKSYGLCFHSTADWGDDKKCERWPHDCAGAIYNMAMEDQENINEAEVALERLRARLRNDVVQGPQKMMRTEVLRPTNGEMLPPRSRPMTLSEIARRYTENPRAKGSKYKGKFEEYELKPVTARTYTIRLDLLDSAFRKRMEAPI
jgi:hypothetical protein